jgi:hypothetical protein
MSTIFLFLVSNDGWSSWSTPEYDPNVTDPEYFITDSQINCSRNHLSNDVKVPPMFKIDWEEGMEKLPHPSVMCYLWALKDSLNQRKNTFEDIKQKPCQTYQQFMIFNSKTLTDQGVQKLNDSIITYVYCVLGAQVSGLN